MKNNNHEHNHSHIHSSDAKENIKVAFLLNLVFSILEFIGGFLTNSISIFTDSIHDFGDSISIGVSYLLEKKSQKKSDNNYTYGYLRYSLLGAIITSLVLLTGSVIVLYNAIPRLVHVEEINYDAMIIFAIFGVFINGYAAYRTSHAEKHNEKAINLHMLEDVLGWIAVLIGSILIKLFKLYIIDPILSILIAIYILYHVYKYMKEIFYIFMEKVPDDINIDTLKNNIKEKFNTVKDIHHIHIWTLDGIKNYLTAHILIDDNTNKKDIIKLKHDIKDYLEDNNIEHSTLEIEYAIEECKTKNCSH